MSAYSFFRPLIHSLPPETAHRLGIWALKKHLIPAPKLRVDPMLAQRVCGLDFAHPVGLAAGFDKNAEVAQALHRQGFSFVEVGTVTPLPQAGNPAPRMFRLASDQAVINRLGFNNAGMGAFVRSLSAGRKDGIIGANIGKNKQTEDAARDYMTGLEAVYAHSDYITINISSPNTQGLRTLQKREQLTQLLGQLMAGREELMTRHGRKVPLFLKIAPDLDEADLQDVAQVVKELNVDALIVSNTTIRRPRTLTSQLHGEQGGLSGVPLFALSTEVLARMYKLTGGTVPLIGVGGIASGLDAYKKIRAGASLVQLYTAIVYQGFGVVRRIVQELPGLLERDGFRTVTEAVGADHR